MPGSFASDLQAQQCLNRSYRGSIGGGHSSVVSPIMELEFSMDTGFLVWYFGFETTFVKGGKYHT